MLFSNPYTLSASTQACGLSSTPNAQVPASYVAVQKILEIPRLMKSLRIDSSC